MRHSIRRFLRRSESGFTMIELIIVLAIMLVASLILLPRLFWFVDRARLRSAGLATKALIQTARLAAMKGGGEGRVVFDFAQRKVYAFVDSNPNGVYDANLEKLLGEYSLSDPGSKATVRFMSHDDTTPDTGGAIQGFDDPPYGGTCGGDGCIVFNASGATQSGAVRFTDGYWNFIEVRILSGATARTEIRKLNRSNSLYLPEVLHLEAGTRAASWNWYEERDDRVPI